MRKRISTPKLIAIATVDGTHFSFPQPKETIEKDQRRTAFYKKKINFK